MKQSNPTDKQTEEKLLLHLLGISKEELFLNKNKTRPNLIQKAKFNFGQMMLAKGYPLQYLTHQADFFGYKFFVNKNVLIPRPETELLVEWAGKKIGQLIKTLNGEINIIDVGTGSGCIIISLCRFCKENLAPSDLAKLNFFAVDISPRALRLARRNAHQNNCPEIKFFPSNLFSKTNSPLKFDLIMANLPYLTEDYIKDNENLRFEPKLALRGGEKGFDILARFLDNLPDRLSQKGAAIIEIDPSQTKLVQNQACHVSTKIIQDLNGFDRFVTFN